MTIRKGSILVGATLAMILSSVRAEAHWCDDLWASSYNIVVRPDSDTSPKEIYVQNNMGYQLISFTLTATGTSGAITLTAPTLKVANTLLPGQKATWKIASGSPAKIEDVTFAVSFGNRGQSACYPTKGAKAVMIVRNDGTLVPAAPPPGLSTPQNPGCAGDLQQGRSLQYQAVADFEDVDAGLDKLLQLYCSGRASWNTGSEAIVPTYCRDTSSTTCPTTKPASATGSKYDYMHLWSAGELAVRKSSLGARAAVFRARLQCGVNDSDLGFGGYAMFILGYLGEDAGAKTFLTTQAGGTGDMATIAKAALYLMGDTAQQAAVQACAKSAGYFAQMACAAALGIVDQDDATVTSTLIPAVKWNEPDVASEDGKGLYAGHLLELVAFARRGWVPNGMGPGSVTFYGETGGGVGGGPGSGGTTGSGGAVGSGGVTGRGGSGGGATTGRDGGVDVRPATGGAIGSGGSAVGGRGGSSAGGAGGANPAGGVVASGGAPASGGAVSAGGVVASGGSNASGGNVGQGGSAGSGGSHEVGGANGSGGSSTTGGGDSGGGCQCNLGGPASSPALCLLTVLGLAAFLRRRRR